MISEQMKATEFYDAMNRVMELHDVEHDMGRAITIIFGFVKDRIQEQKIAGEKSNDFPHVLLEYEEKGREGPRKIS
ncbi:hypothetical protein SADUNF_Sadunf06G0094800 [Salix dunnii]|uniref:Uncharacterized protein n=1 Tax=Salix dunnii TaxID=1413687 RepID=A0A835K186_9ROSI|nr:hypothetical protein SADUNF_Sadunf06G0094800 [Salix dunnii]